MKRILLPAGGALVATGLLAAGLAGTAQADSDVASDPMATSAANAKAIAEFWADNNGAALRAAKESNNWDKSDVAKLQSKGGYSADTKPGSTAPIGQEKKTTVKVQNVNMPKTIGKVFFVNSKGEKKWCSATSIQSQYRNLVATAGHCVYDTATNSDVLSKWVFVPGYYQGKTPFGIYVGKQAFTHYDFDVYEDYDRDYAFVTVYNGVKLGGGTPKQVSKADWDKYTGIKDAKDVEISREEFLKGQLDPTRTEAYWVKEGTAPEATGPDYPGAAVGKVEVTEDVYKDAKVGKGNGFKFGEPVTEIVTDAEAAAYKAKQGDKPTDKYPAKVVKDERGNWTITHYYVQQWYKPGSEAKYYKTVFFIVEGFAKDAGRLGDNVGGQGFAWNQPTGKYVRVFGYPAAPHPDGNKNFTGVTPKWCYGKTTKKLVGSAAKKIEEHVALKCAFTEGADGGPWLYKYSNSKRLGYVNGVVSTFNDQDGNGRVDYISSPYFDGETNVVYKAAAASWSGKLV
ncbi:trypsin-like serine peptidase [Nonomuraea sp. NPDC050153]|uniref:trypsin-like serine peptidase n=1 Tax=Nonomuraea sp. NPDC050153 TaxID=3364359 RepID=UPI0037A49E10